MPTPTQPFLSVEPLTFQQNAQGDYIDAAPGDVEPYTLGWLDSIQYPAETIAAAAWTYPSSVVGTSPAMMPGSLPAIVGATTTEWLSAVIAGSYEVACTITTSMGRVKTKSFQLIVAENI